MLMDLTSLDAMSDDCKEISQVKITKQTVAKNRLQIVIKQQDFRQLKVNVVRT